MAEGKEKTKRLWIVAFATILVLAWLGAMFVIFPVGNPLDTIGGTAGSGFFYAALISVILMVFILLYFAIRSTLKDFLQALEEELSLDFKEIGRQYGRIFWDDILALLGKKDRISDHHDD